MKLSVIVVIVDGGEQLERCLAAIEAQQDGPPMETLVPWDDTVPGMAACAARYPRATFIALGTLAAPHPKTSHAGLHDLYDQRRTAGLNAATGDLVAMLEDRSVPEPGWAAAALRAHAERPQVVIGGALASGRRGVLGHADYLCDFYRFRPPLEAGPLQFVSYVNICYKRAALERTRPLWTAWYYDLTVHRALQADGEQLWLAPAMLVRQERADGTRFVTLVGERLAWGRRYAVRRTKAEGGRAGFLLRAPLVPLLLWLRALRSQRGAALGPALLAAPAMLCIYGAWGLGEFLGYATGRD